MKVPALFILLTQLSPGLIVRDYASTRHDRFVGFPVAPKPNPNFFHAATDLTGVGWYLSPTQTAKELRRQYTMVSPKHFVGAYHFRPSVNGSIRFVTGDGIVRTYAVGTVHTILNDDGDPSDLFIGTLENEIPESDGINFQPFLSVTEANYVGKELIFLGHFNESGMVTHRAGRGVFQGRVQFGQGTAIGDTTSLKKTEGFFWIYKENKLFSFGDSDDAYVEAGDSGSPSLVDVDGKGAIVGTHSLVRTETTIFTTEITNFDTFVPFHIDLLNAGMEAEGYHMTRAVPGNIKPRTTLTITETVPSVIRAGYSVTIPIMVTNIGLLEDANNLKFSQTLPTSSGTSLTGPRWVASGSGDLVEARRGGLLTDTGSSLVLTFTPELPGSFTSDVTFSADEFDEVTEVVELEVIESYLSWSSMLIESGQTSDPDGDGITNLHEYAFGGDPELASVVQVSTGERLLPSVTETSSGVVVSFLRRIEAGNRALTYEVEASSSLAAGSWNEVTGAAVEGSPSPVNSEFERVSLEITEASELRFFRLKVTLEE
ncbi:MAG: hypothetical protein QNK82_08865 [Akkermansiaceae bacterium]|jgi:hypothetical protein